MPIPLEKFTDLWYNRKEQTTCLLQLYFIANNRKSRSHKVPRKFQKRGRYAYTFIIHKDLEKIR